MSYEKHMFHRIADEAWRIANYEDTSDLDDDDLFKMADAVVLIIVDRGNDKLAISSGCVFAASLGGMYEVFQELPEAKEKLLDYLLESDGYEFMASENFFAYVKGANE